MNVVRWSVVLRARSSVFWRLMSGMCSLGGVVRFRTFAKLDAATRCDRYSSVSARDAMAYELPPAKPKKKKGNRSAASPEAAPSVASSEPAAPVELRLPEAANAVGRVIFLPSALLPPGLGPSALAEVPREGGAICWCERALRWWQGSAPTRGSQRRILKHPIGHAEHPQAPEALRMSL